MFNNGFKSHNFRFNSDIEKFSRLLLMNKKIQVKHINTAQFYGIKNFWIIANSGITLFSLENSLFVNQDERNLFGGFITAVISLSEILTKSRLTEVKIDTLTINIQSFSNFFIVSIIEENKDLSLKFLEKFSSKFTSEINDSILTFKPEILSILHEKYFSLQNDFNLRKEIINEAGIDYLSKYIFNLSSLEDLFKKLYSLLSYLPKESHHEFLDSIYLYSNKIKIANQNPELVSQINLVLEGLYSSIRYAIEKSEDNYQAFIKNLFLLFTQFFNQITYVY